MKDKRVVLAVIMGFLVGMVWLVAVRFVTYRPDVTHHHANFALYINGQRDEFSNFTFYEEVQSCAADEANNPRHRTHMHDQVNHVVHVHEPGVMWGHFFANLGYTLGDTLIKTDGGTFLDGTDGSELTFMLNGQKVNNIANRPINSEDTLLINYDRDNDQTLQSRYNQITKDAADYNQRDDPSSCAGPKKLTPVQRLKEAIGIF